MNKEEIIIAIDSISKYASQSKFSRLFATPFKYVYGIFYRNIYYKVTQKGRLKSVKTFWGDTIKVLLPASMDIYLIGGKTHDSEIRLAKFYVNYLNTGDDVLDIGSHIGYFSLLSATLSPKGTTVAIEASPSTFNLLNENVKNKKNVITQNIAISNETGAIEFLEFPVLYSEYNTLEQTQYENEDWFKSIQPTKVKINSKTGTSIIQEFNLQPQIIKIDVEGAEEKVIQGLIEYLRNNTSYVVMEFANEERGNVNHINAERLLKAIDYFPFKINSFGKLEEIGLETSVYVSENKLESDNIVYYRV